MNNADTEKLIELFESQAGYRVTIAAVAEMREHTRVLSTSPQAADLLLGILSVARANAHDATATFTK